MKPNITLKIFYKNETKETIQTKKIKRIYYHIQKAKILGVSKYNLRVNYGKHLNNKDKKTMFINEGEYTKFEDLKHALQCFTE
jgi:hypothetical protein